MATDDDRDDGEDELEEQAESGGAASEGSPQSDPNTPRNRAERRAAAKAARRGREAVLADENAKVADDSGLDPDSGLLAPTTSMGGSPVAIDGPPGAPRRKPPPRTMSRGTGSADGVPEWVRRWGDRLAANRGVLGIAALGVLVSIGAAVGYTVRRDHSAASAAADFSAALAISDAPITEASDSSASTGPSFRTLADRQRASLDRFRKVIRDHGTSAVAPLAKLAEAGLLYQLGRYQEAKVEYTSLLGHDVAGLDARVLEGLGFSLEATGDLNGALARYRELQTVHGGDLQDLARFYQARLLYRQNQRDQAKDLLHGVAERTARPGAADPLAPVQSDLHQQTIALLRDIDPRDTVVIEADRARSAAGRQGEHGEQAPGGQANPLQNIPPEILRQLMQQQQQRQQGAPVPAPSAPAPSAPAPAAPAAPAPAR